MVAQPVLRCIAVTVITTPGCRIIVQMMSPYHRRQVRGGDYIPVHVADGSAADLRELNLDAVDLPVEMACHTADSWVRHVRPAGACE